MVDPHLTVGMVHRRLELPLPLLVATAAATAGRVLRFCWRLLRSVVLVRFLAYAAVVRGREMLPPCIPATRWQLVSQIQGTETLWQRR
jgi:hypothetical protein